MKIHKLSYILAFPFLLIALYIGYLTFKDSSGSQLIWALVPAVALVLIYLFSPQIDYWWLSRKPVEMDHQITDLLTKTNPTYGALDDETKNEFHKRLLLFTEGKEFLAKGMEQANLEVPYDVQNMIAQIPITMTLGRRDFTLKRFERVVLYKHPFPTPKNRFLHTSEIHAEDGVIILSLEHVQAAMMQPGYHYDVGWHAFAEAFISSHPKEPWPDLPSDIWSKVDEISPQNQKMILGTLGFEMVDVMPVLVTLYFRHADRFRAVLPGVADVFQSIFNDGSAGKAIS